MKRHKIILFAQDGIGGAEKVSSLIGNYLHAQKQDVCFCLVDVGSNGKLSNFINSEIELFKICGKNPLVLLWNMLFVILKMKPSCVFSSVINLNNKLLLLKYLFPYKRFIVRCDTNLSGYNKKQIKMIRFLYPKADTIIAQTEEMRDELIRELAIDEKKIKVIHNPIDKDSIDIQLSKSGNPYPDNSLKHYVAMGRFHPVKGFDLLVDAFILVCNRRKDVDLFIVGDYNDDGGVIYNSLVEKVKNAGFENKFHCVGYQENPYSYSRYADCFVLSSHWEGLPNALIESLYLGTPAAAFECVPILNRIIDNGSNGYLADNGNIEELANAMDKAIELGRIHSLYKPGEMAEFEKFFI